MTVPRIRNEDFLDGERRLRDLIWERLPPAGIREGVVASDLDCVLRFYGPCFGLDREGRFGLLEVKHGTHGLTGGQRWSFALLDQVLRASPLAGRYLGLAVIHDHGDGWSWGSEEARLDDDELIARLLAWPRSAR